MSRGFTLLEVLLTIAIIVLMVALSIPFYNAFRIVNQWDVLVSEIVQALRRAQIKSMSLEKESSWGVYFDKNIGAKDRFILFRGESYSSRDPDYDEITELPSILSFIEINFNNEGTEVIFKKINGTTDDYGFLKIQAVNNDQRTITINEVGRISVQ